MKTKKIFTLFTVEDNSLYALILKHNLGYRVEYLFVNYYSGEDCIKNLNLKPDLIILDFNLLGMNGLDTLRKIRELSVDIPVVILTYETGLNVTQQFQALGVSGIIDKNNDPLTFLIPLIDQIYHTKIALIS